MTLNLRMPDKNDLKPRITVFGVGGAGGNAVNNMIEKELEGADFVVANTDAQALSLSQSSLKVQMGAKVTEGLGAGARPSVGAASAEESIEEIVDHLAGSHMCFITAGMGGGTGTGAAPIIAQAARELGVLTVGVVTKPFQFEGAKRMRQAEEGVEALQKVVDTLIIIPNQNLFRLANEKTTFTEAFSMADDVLYQGVKGVTDLMVRPGIINLDFADVRSVMDEMGKAMMGTGEATGEDRAIQAAEKAIANPLLDEISLNGARGVLINITGGHDLTLFELDEAANRIREEVDPDANIIVGSTLDTGMDGVMRVSVVATGIDASEMVMEVPVPRRTLAEPLTPPKAVVEEAPLTSMAPPVFAANPVADPIAVAQQDEPAFEHDLLSQIDGSDSDGDVDSLFADSGSGEHFEDDTVDTVPEPVYSGQPAHEEHATISAEPAANIAGFVAPKPPPTGAPSPEALARLQAAVSKVPGRQEEAPKAEAPPQLPPLPEKSSRFGINNLINRMTGHASDPEPPTEEAAVEPVAIEAPAPAPAETKDPEQERIDIPAFLRRQAN